MHQKQIYFIVWAAWSFWRTGTLTLAASCICCRVTECMGTLVPVDSAGRPEGHSAGCRDCCSTKNIPMWNFSWRFDYKRTAKRWLQGESTVKEKRVLVFQILLTAGGGGGGMVREGGAEKSLRRVWNNRAEWVIPVPQAFVLPLQAGCVCARAASWPAVSLNCP